MFAAVRFMFTSCLAIFVVAGCNGLEAIPLVPNDAAHTGRIQLDAGVVDGNLDAGELFPDVRMFPDVGDEDATIVMIDAEPFPDANTPDALASSDTGQADSGVHPDAAAPDATSVMLDAMVRDTSTFDSGAPDGGPGLPDSGWSPPDGSTIYDGGVPDSGPSCPGRPNLAVSTPPGTQPPLGYARGVAASGPIMRLLVQAGQNDTEVGRMGFVFENTNYSAAHQGYGLNCGIPEGVPCFANMTVTGVAGGSCTTTGITVRNFGDNYQFVDFICAGIIIPACSSRILTIEANFNFPTQPLVQPAPPLPLDLWYEYRISPIPTECSGCGVYEAGSSTPASSSAIAYTVHFVP